MGSTLKVCIVCKGKKFSPYSPKVIQCQACGLVVAKEIPTAIEVEELYQKEYFFGMEYFDYEADRPALEGNFRRRIANLSEMIQPDYKIVEIGCAYGYFLKMIESKVGDHIGFDVSNDGVKYAKDQLGVNASTDEFLHYKFKPDSIDSVFMWDVIEHLSYPDDYVKQVADILKPGGRVALTTGDIDTIVPRIRKGGWRMIHPPTHVYYFSSKTITRLLNKHGFTVESIKHKSVSRNVGSMLKQIIGNRKALGKSVYLLDLLDSGFSYARINRLNIPLNTFDIMQVVAIKN